MDAVRFGRPATAYAYNGYYLSRSSGISWPPPTFTAAPATEPATRRLAEVKTLSQTIAFADSAQVRLTQFAPPLFSFEENWILDAPSRNFPDVHFRHGDSANVAFLDGHVETRRLNFRVDIPGSNFLSAAQATLMKQHQLGFISDGNLNDPTRQDELYDRK